MGSIRVDLDIALSLSQKHSTSCFQHTVFCLLGLATAYTAKKQGLPRKRDPGVILSRELIQRMGQSIASDPVNNVFVRGSECPRAYCSAAAVLVNWVSFVRTIPKVVTRLTFDQQQVEVTARISDHSVYFRLRGVDGFGPASVMASSIEQQR